MTASANDKLRIASGSTRPVVTTLALPKANGATTAELTSATGWNTTTGVDVVIYRRQLNTTTGLYEKIDGTQTEWVGALTGTTLSGLTLAAGTEPASGYAADGNSVVFCGPTAQWSDDLVQTLLTLFNQDQTLKPGPIQTALGLGASSLNGWNVLGFAPSTVTYNGNRSYDLVFTSQDLTSTLSAGMRLRTTRTVAAPTQCTSLNGTTQYYSKTSPAGMTFTNNFVVGAHGKPNAYGTKMVLASRFDGTSGWELFQDTTGQIVLRGYNAGAANYSEVRSYQSVALNKWDWVVAQLDMATFTATPTTSYIMIGGVDVPASVARAGTNPTALVQAGSLFIGASNSTTPASFYSGKLAQVFVSSAKITQANIRTLYSQGLTSALITANSIISAYSFDGVITDLNTTNANNLTANGSAIATNADSPMGQQASGLISSTLDYMIIQKSVFSTNTTVTVQVPEGCTIPTSGGVSAVVYSSQAAPYGFPKQRTKWDLLSIIKATQGQSSPVANTWYNPSWSLTLPLGEWDYGYEAPLFIAGSSSSMAPQATLSTSASSETNTMLTSETNASAVTQIIHTVKRDDSISTSAQIPVYMNLRYIAGSTITSVSFLSSDVPGVIRARNAWL